MKNIILFAMSTLRNRITFDDYTYDGGYNEF